MGTKITALPQVVTPVGTDELPISQDIGSGSRITYKATLDQIKDYVKTSGGGTGTITSVGITSTDGSIEVFNSPITSSGIISLTINSVGLDKLDDGGATNGEVLTYNASTNEWEPSLGGSSGSSGIRPNILVGNGGTTYTLTDFTNDIASNYLVFVGGVAQRPTTDFTISGSSIIFGSTVPTGVQILVYAVINIVSLNLDTTPIGTVSWFAASAAPTSYLECSGGVVAISEYLDLYNVIGKKYNTGGEGASNFRLPDLRGEFIRGWDHGRDVDTGRVFGSWQKGSIHNIGAGPTSDTVCDYNTNPGIQGRNDSGYDVIDDLSIYSNFFFTNKGEPVQAGVPQYTDMTYGATRPRNVALLPCIKAQKTVTGSTNVVQSSFTIDGSMLAKAWVSFNGKKDTTGANSTNNTNRLINASYNVDSVSRNKQGEYKINFKSETFDSANYCYTLGKRTDSDGTYQEVLVTYGEKSLSALVIQSDTDGPNQLEDLSEICLTFYASGGDLTGTANVFDSTPIGTVNWFAASAAPTSYLECNGAAVLKSDYSNLFTVIGNTYTSVASANHFRLPDLRGEFIRGWDHARGVDTGRVFGSWEEYGTAIPKNTNLQSLNSDGTIRNLDNATNPSIAGFARVSKTGESTTTGAYDSGNSGKELDLANVVLGDSETRPRNVALLPCIKALKTVTGNVNTLNFIEKPAGPTNGQVLTYNGSTATWVASAGNVNTLNFIEKPAGPTNGQVLTYNGSTATWVASAGNFSSSNITRGTAVTLTNQTSVDFTSIPNWARRITICLSGFSTNGSSLPKIQLGSGSIRTSGYKGAVWAGTVAATHHSSGFYLINSSTADSYLGHTIVTLINMMDNLWMVSMTGGYESVYICVGGGSVTLSGTLDRLRLTTENGTDQFDAGIVNIMWE